MGPYDHRHITLDPGLTALALRALHERDGQYPFMSRFTRRRARRPVRSAEHTVRLTGRRAASFWPRSLRPTELFPTFSRLVSLGGSSAAA